MDLPDTSHSSQAIVKISRVPTYDEFLETHLKPNHPAIIGHSLIKDWEALKKWTRPSTPGSSTATREIDWDYLAEAYGDEEVSVSDCGKKDSFGNLECESNTFASIVQEWKAGEGQKLYVKDWHLAKSVEAPSSDADSAAPRHPFYSTPDLFKDDWMNAYYTSHTSDDFRFVYVGAAGTYTPLHRDVYCSYSWSTNVCGRKRWWLFPPEQTSLLFMRERNVCVHDVRDVDSAQFPYFSKATPLVVEQEEGETIFVPSGWYHQVENLTACISINHNWCNSVNLPMLYSSMCDKVVEVENALDDVRQLLQKSHVDDERAWKAEFCTVVQQLVEQDAGWNWLTFWRMVNHALKSAAAQEGFLELGDKTQRQPTAQPIFPYAPARLRPSFSFIRAQIKSCYDDFVKRDRLECEGEVGTVTQEVAKLLAA